MPDSYRLAGARLASLDEFGLDAAVLFPNYGLLWEQRLASDREAQRANARAYNRFVADVCSDGDGPPLRRGARACCTTRPGRWRRSRGSGPQGLRLAMIAPAPVDGKPLSHADFDPVWAAFSDAGRRAGVPRLGVREPAAPGLARGRTGGRRAALRFHLLVPGAGGRAGQPHPATGCSSASPDLRIGVVELTASWVPSFLLHIDGASDFYAPAARRALPRARRAPVGVLLAPGAGGRAALRDAEPPRAQGGRRHLHDRQRLAPRRGRRRPDGCGRAGRGRAWPTRRGPTSWEPTPPGSSDCDRRPRGRRRRAGAPAGDVPAGAGAAGRGRRPAACTTWRCCAPTSSGPSASTKGCSASRWSSSSRTGTTRVRRTCSSTWATTTRWPSSTFPGLGLGPYAEVLGGFHHLAISVDRAQWDAARARLEEAGIPTQIESEISLVLLRPRRRAARADRRGPRLARTARRCTDGRHRPGQPGRQGRRPRGGLRLVRGGGRHGDRAGRVGERAPGRRAARRRWRSPCSPRRSTRTPARCPTRGSCTPPCSSTTSTPSWPATRSSGVRGP